MSDDRRETAFLCPPVPRSNREKVWFALAPNPNSEGLSTGKLPRESRLAVLAWREDGSNAKLPGVVLDTVNTHTTYEQYRLPTSSDEALILRVNSRLHKEGYRKSYSAGKWTMLDFLGDEGACVTGWKWALVHCDNLEHLAATCKLPWLEWLTYTRACVPVVHRLLDRAIWLAVQAKILPFAWHAVTTLLLEDSSVDSVLPWVKEIYKMATADSDMCAISERVSRNSGFILQELCAGAHVVDLSTELAALALLIVTETGGWLPSDSLEHPAWQDYRVLVGQLLTEAMARKECQA